MALYGLTVNGYTGGMTQTQASDELTAALDKIGARQRNARVTLHDIAAIADDAPRLLAAVDAVLNLHVPRVSEGAQPFRYCSRCSGHPAWPCPEVQAISRALSGGAA